MSDLIERQAAIDGLDGHYVERRNLNDWQAGWNAALDWMGSTYLDELPSAQPEPSQVARDIATIIENEVDMRVIEKRTDKRTETHACDLVSRQQAIEACLRGKTDVLPATNVACDCCAERIRVLPSAQPERCEDCENFSKTRLLIPQPEIIACGDCKHWICHDRRCGYWNHGVKPLDWCSHAERRTDEADKR